MVAFSRGAVGFLAINRADTPADELLDTGLPAGIYKELIGGGTVTVGQSGQAQLHIDSLAAVALLASQVSFRAS